MTTAQQLAALTPSQLAATWNVLQWQRNAGLDRKDVEADVKKELESRGIKPVYGKRLKEKR